MEENAHVFTHPADVAKVSGAIRRFATEGGDYDVVYRTKAPDEDHYTIIHALGKHVPTNDGRQLAVIWYADEGAIKTGPETEDIEVNLTVLNHTMQDILSADYVMRRYHYDDVTGLPNMSYFIQLASMSHRNYPAADPAVVFFDLTGMKRYNERYGFAQGNRLLRGFAEILQDKITILAEIIEWPEEIDESRAESALQRAKERLERRDSHTDLARAETALQRAIARIEVLK
jgi:hypothetical protein